MEQKICYLNPLRLVIAAASVLMLAMLLKERSSQVRLVMLDTILCLWRLVISLPRPTTDTMLQFDSLTLAAPSP